MLWDRKLVLHPCSKCPTFLTLEQNKTVWSESTVRTLPAPLLRANQSGWQMFVHNGCLLVRSQGILTTLVFLVIAWNVNVISEECIGQETVAI